MTDDEINELGRVFTGLGQGTPEWDRIRIGKATASRIGDVCARTKTGWGAGRGNYMAELVCERLTKQRAPEGYKSAAMERGNQVEVDARISYAFHTDNEVQQVDFVNHPTIAMTGASPDGWIGTDGILELKCPMTKTHMDTIQTRTVPGHYHKQALWNLACSGRAWVDYVSYDPRLPANLRLCVIRIERDDKEVDELEKIVAAFLRELDDLEAAMRAFGA